jgi:multiple sugar transport system substrate-binding protein
MEKYPHYPKLLEISKTATSRPIIPQYAQISDILQRYLSAALTNYLPPEKAMRLAANETRQILGKNRV